MNKNIERRIFTARDFRVEKREGDGQRVIRGYAAVFGESADIWGFTEEIRQGAFSDSIKKDDIRALFNHDPNIILGRNRSKTLSLREDDHGLFIEINPPDTQAARDLVTSIERGDINQQSFGFRTLEDQWATQNGKPHRTLVRAQLFDVSPVTFPAYEGTQVDVALRSLAQFVGADACAPCFGSGAEFRGDLESGLQPTGRLCGRCQGIGRAASSIDPQIAAATRDRDLQLLRFRM